MSDEDIVVLQKSLSVLNKLGIWPDFGKYSNPGKVFYIKFVLFWLSYWPWVITVFSHTIWILKKNVGLNVSEEMAIGTTVVGMMYVITFYILNQKSLNQFYRDLSNFRAFGEPPNVDNETRRLNLVSTIFFCYTLFGIVCYIVFAALRIPKCLKVNKLLIPEENCGVVIPAWYPFNIDYFPIRELHFILQTIAGFRIVTGGAMITLTLYECSYYVVLRINHLKKLLTEVFDDKDYQIRRQRLHFCIRYHNDIIVILKNFNCCYKTSMGVHLVITGITFGCLGYSLVTNLTIPCVLHLTGYMCEMYFVSQTGQLMTNKSLSIADAAYNSKWHDVELDLQKDLSMVILRAQRLFYMQSGSFGNISLAYLIGILRTSYSYITLLRQTL